MKSKNTLVDPRDGQTYRTVELNGLIWMAQNLNYDVGKDCWWYGKAADNGEKYGLLYTWEAAQKAYPPGWRLPTLEEWKSLAESFGGYYDGYLGKDVGDPKKAYAALLNNGTSGFNAQLGGGRNSDGSFFGLGQGGSYWAATAYDTSNAWYHYFDRDGDELGLDYYYTSLGRSCRCVRINYR